jgi:hypothetical protein
MTILAEDDLVIGNQQWSELQASPHRGFACTVCHVAHVSVSYGIESGIRNDCVACHGEIPVGFHVDTVYVRGDYTEPMTCESCHMAYAAKNASSIDIPVPSAVVTFGDTASHLFAIDVNRVDPSDLFTPDGTQVAVDESGNAGLPTGFVCQRCHNGQGNAFPLSPDAANGIARGIHEQ